MRHEPGIEDIVAGGYDYRAHLDFDELVVLTQGADGSMANELFRIRGVLRSVAEGVDRAGVYMTMDGFRTLLVLPDGAHQIIVRTPEGAIVIDETGKRNGRGAYLCTQMSCWERALERKHLEHALKVELTTEAQAQLTEFAIGLPQPLSTEPILVEDAAEGAG